MKPNNLNARRKNFLSLVSLICSLVLTTASFASPTPTIEFRYHGEKVKTLSLEELQALLPKETVRVHDIHEQKPIDFHGFPLRQLIDSVYDAKNDWDEVVVTCRDGYEPSLDRSYFNNYTGYLAFGRADQPGLELIDARRNNEKIDATPFYFVWDNLKNPKLNDEPGSLWSYQVVAIDLVSAVEKYPNMSPPQGASDQVMLGFKSFRKYCFSCHTINGEGGNLGPELNSPINSTEKIKEEWLRQWIEDPFVLYPNVKMTPLKWMVKDEKERKKVLDAIIAYLKVMTGKKISPQPPP